MPAFPEADWFLTLGRLMETEGELFRRLGYAEVRFAIRVMNDDGESTAALTGLEIDGYKLSQALELKDVAAFDPDFVVCARRETWQRMLDEIIRDGRPNCAIR